jgi:hypothetical protein
MTMNKDIENKDTENKKQTKKSWIMSPMKRKCVKK